VTTLDGISAPSFRTAPPAIGGGGGGAGGMVMYNHPPKGTTLEISA